MQLALFHTPTNHDRVYAMRGPRRLIKFGTTARPIRYRSAELGAIVLAVCAGSRRDEARIHHQLRRWRIPGTEWFWPAPEVEAMALELARRGRFEKHLHHRGRPGPYTETRSSHVIDGTRVTFTTYST